MPREAIDCALAIKKRKARHLSLAMLAYRLSELTGAEVGKSNVYEWERGNARPPSFVVNAWCTALGMSRADFVLPNDVKRAKSA